MCNDALDTQTTRTYITGMMIIKSFLRAPVPVSRHFHPTGSTLGSARTAITWAIQDHWEDADGPLGVNRPSPKLAPLTAKSPQWLRELHDNGVQSHVERMLRRSIDIIFSGLSSRDQFPRRGLLHMRIRVRNGLKGLTWDISEMIGQPGSPRISPNTAMEGYLISEN